MDQTEALGRAARDVVDDALATALERASAAGQWGVVEVLARELQARRASGRAEPAEVIGLNDAKRRRRS